MVDGTSIKIENLQLVTQIHTIKHTQFSRMTFPFYFQSAHNRMVGHSLKKKLLIDCFDLRKSLAENVRCRKKSK